MSFLKVNTENCTRCGRCAQVCPANVIRIGANGPAAIDETCLRCGHCVAVCPREALDNPNTPLANQTLLENRSALDAETAANFLRSRRSIRGYQPVAVPREKIRQLLDIARYAQTAANSQGIAYHVVDDPDTLNRITAAIVNWAAEESKNDSEFSAALATLFNHSHQTGQDFVLRGAPCLVLSLVDQALPASSRENGRFPLVYAELYAPSIGLGSCWCGIFEYCVAAGYQPLLDLLKLPENMNLAGAIMIGYPQYRFERLVERNPLRVTWQESINH